MTSRGELGELALALFLERGFETTTVDDVAAAAGIARRTFFRYFASKNDLVWGDFDAGLAALRARLAAAPAPTGLYDALREAVLEFNRFDPAETALHRGRMELVLHVPALQAHSTLRYAAWRAVVAEFVARRLGEPVDGARPQLVAHTVLAATVAGYEQWLARPGSELAPLLDEALRGLGAGHDALA